MLHRSYLYAPGSSPRVMRQALASGADAVILDLEDAVADSAKSTARTEIRNLLSEVAQEPVAPDVHVRINRDGLGYLESDLDAVAWPGLDAIRLPKAESPDAIASVAATLDDLERRRALEPGHISLYLTVESALGAVSIPSLATATSRVARMAIGTTDLLADLGAVGDDGLATLHVRSEMVLHSRVAGIGPPIDSVHTDLDDESGLRAAAERARALGFHGKSVIHPRQLEVVHAVFSPTDEELARAERIVAALESAQLDGRGALEVDGTFVDAAVAARAHSLLDLRRRC